MTRGAFASSIAAWTVCPISGIRPSSLQNTEHRLIATLTADAEVDSRTPRDRPAAPALFELDARVTPVGASKVAG